MPDRCEYNPKDKQPSFDPPAEGDCPNMATVSLGARGAWHVCASCAALPEFAKFRVRQQLGASPTAEKQS